MILNCTTSGDNTIMNPKPGYEIHVYGLAAMAVADVNIKFKSGNTDISGLLYPAARGGAVLPIANGSISDNSKSRASWMHTNAGEALIGNLSTGVVVSGLIVAEYVKA